jgi:hypothetical protein
LHSLFIKPQIVSTRSCNGGPPHAHPTEHTAAQSLFTSRINWKFVRIFHSWSHFCTSRHLVLATAEPWPLSDANAITVLVRRQVPVRTAACGSNHLHSITTCFGFRHSGTLLHIPAQHRRKIAIRTSFSWWQFCSAYISTLPQYNRAREVAGEYGRRLWQAAFEQQMLLRKSSILKDHQESEQTRRTASGNCLATSRCTAHNLVMKIHES